MTKREELHDLMRDGYWHGARELSERVSHRFSAYLFDLTREGVWWEKRRHPQEPAGARWWQYRLLPEGVARCGACGRLNDTPEMTPHFYPAGGFLYYVCPDCEGDDDEPEVPAEYLSPDDVPVLAPPQLDLEYDDPWSPPSARFQKRAAIALWLEAAAGSLVATCAKSADVDLAEVAQAEADTRAAEYAEKNCRQMLD